MATFAEIRRELDDKRDTNGKSALREWMQHVPENLNTQIVEYTFGETERYNNDSLLLRYRADEGLNVQILLDGVAEIFEDHMVHLTDSSLIGSRACRPIRLIEAGDILGDFSFLDRCFFEESMFLNSLSRPREGWNISWGLRSGYFVPDDDPSAVTKDKFTSPDLKSKGASWLKANLNVHQDCFGVHIPLRAKHCSNKIRVAKLDFSNVEPDTRRSIGRQIIQDTSWRRLYTYRSAENSYNIGEKLKFEYGAKLAAHEFIIKSSNNREIKEEFRNDMIGRINNSISFNDFLDVYIAAIYDAINRPLRDEPVFCFEAGSGPLGIYADPDLIRLGKLLFPARISKSIRDVSEFYFPIGASNFLVANYALSFGLKDKLISSFRIQDKVLEHWDSTKEYEIKFDDKSTETRFSIIWQALAQRILDFHLEPAAFIDNCYLKHFFGNENIPSFSGVNAATFGEILRERVINGNFSSILRDYPLSLSVVRLRNLLGGCDIYLKYTRKLP